MRRAIPFRSISYARFFRLTVPIWTKSYRTFRIITALIAAEFSLFGLRTVSSSAHGRNLRIISARRLKQGVHRCCQTPPLKCFRLSPTASRSPRAYIEQVRGVDSSGTVSTLLEKELIEECGKLDVPGRPTLFRTTEAFLRSFGISSVEELPDLSGFDGEEGDQLSLLFSSQQVGG